MAFFVAIHVAKPHGILGLKSGKKPILQKMLNLHSLMIPVRHPFYDFAPENTPLFQENQYNHIRFDSLNPPFHYPRTHDSAKASLRAQYSRIPTFHYSICERSEPTCQGRGH